MAPDSASHEGGDLERGFVAEEVAEEFPGLGLSWALVERGPAATTESGLGSLEWDVLPQTLDMYAHGDHGFLIRDASESGPGLEQSFNSREKGADNPPQLVISYD